MSPAPAVSSSPRDEDLVEVPWRARSRPPHAGGRRPCAARGYKRVHRVPLDGRARAAARGTACRPRRRPARVRGRSGQALPTGGCACTGHPRTRSQARPRRSRGSPWRRSSPRVGRPPPEARTSPSTNSSSWAFVMSLALEVFRRIVGARHRGHGGLLVQGGAIAGFPQRCVDVQKLGVGQSRAHLWR